MREQEKHTVVKSSGQLVNFELNKLENSLEKSKASKELIAEVMNTIVEEYYDGMSTKEIYNKAFSLLRQKERHAAGRYKLKNAISELGPTGYPFEKYIAELYRIKNYKVETGKIIPGHCVFHEMDVIAINASEKRIIECKFHSDSNRHSDVKVPLYIHSRFEDIREEYEQTPESKQRKLVGYIYTNTRFTKDAVQYALCKSMNLVAWDFPHKYSLREQIDAAGLYPITCLTTISLAEKKSLLSMDVVLTRDLCRHHDLLKKIGVRTTKRYNAILEEAGNLCEIERNYER